MDESRYPVSAHGWSSDLEAFRDAPVPYIRQSLIDFLRIVSPEQLRAWDLSIPPLQNEFGEIIGREPMAAQYSAILEYQLPLEQRRPDVILLMGGGVLVLELKSKSSIDLADVDQASAYARDLRAYHRECETRPVFPALVLMNGSGRMGATAGVEIIGPDVIDELAGELDERTRRNPITRAAFLSPSAYRPLPTIVEAARQLMESGDIHRIHRADAATRPTLAYLVGVAHEAAATRTRHLVLLGGLPGTGKTLVGLQLAHTRSLDDLATPRANGKPTTPAVYLSGNGPLVEVLQYELRAAGGGGKAFVRALKQYVRTYANNTEPPPEHVLIFDEAQRAFDAQQVAAKQGPGTAPKSEPEHFVEFAERVPDWCVVVGLVGEGQEIHVGEEAGIGQWRGAIDGAAGAWTVHAPEQFAGSFDGLDDLRRTPLLYLTAELRFHLASTVHTFVDGLLGDVPSRDLAAMAIDLEVLGYPLRVSRDLPTAKAYLHDRYRDDPDARYGLVASSRDRALQQFGVPNGYIATDRVRKGPWFGLGADDPTGQSCRFLTSCVTEFGCQGLELNGVLLAWGTDFVIERNAWTNRNAKRYQAPGLVKDALGLRRNAYRVLLTRARDGVVVFVPPIPTMDETFARLVGAGFREIEVLPNV